MKILVAGMGNIGMRHVEALAKLKCNAEIFLLSKYKISMEKTIDNYINAGGNRKNIFALSSVDELPMNIDIAILANNSGERYFLFKKLVYQKRIKKFILEKIVFNQITHYKNAEKIIQKEQLNVWVNYCFRQYMILSGLNEKVEKLKIEKYIVSGNFGLACNITHWLDLFTYITGKQILHLDGSHLDNNCIPSKRIGYIEFTGTVQGMAEGGIPITIIQTRGCKDDTIIKFQESDNYYIEINVTNQIYIIKKEDILIKGKFPIDYQSNITQKYIEDIFNIGVCSIPKFDEISNMSILVLKMFLDKQQLNYNQKCNIT